MGLVKLKDVCDFQKGITGLAKAEPGEFPLVTTGAERKTCNAFQFDTRAVCIPLVSSTGHGHASINNVHYQEGKFALGTILVALTSKNEKELDIHFLHLYLSQLKDQVLVPLMSGAANVALSVTKIQNVEISLPSIERQKKIVEKFKSIVQEEDEIKSELTRQQTLLKQLRQQILQEAIEGKHTTDWRAKNTDVEPANELLARIQEEKEQLIKDHKIKKQKSLPQISEEEKQFALPDGWAWCRLGNISEVKVGATPQRGNSDYWGGEVNWVSSGEVSNNYIDGTKEFITKKGVEETSAKINPKGSVLVAMIGQGKTRGQTAILNIDAATNQNVCAIRLMSEVLPEIVWYFFLSRYEKTRSGASGGNQPALNGIKISNTVFALPPVDETRAIVDRLRCLEPILDQLETQISLNQTHADQLMQAVLKEAFSHNASESETDNAQISANA